LGNKWINEEVLVIDDSGDELSQVGDHCIVVGVHRNNKYTLLELERVSDGAMLHLFDERVIPLDEIIIEPATPVNPWFGFDLIQTIPTAATETMMKELEEQRKKRLAQEAGQLLSWIIGNTFEFDWARWDLDEDDDEQGGIVEGDFVRSTTTGMYRGIGELVYCENGVEVYKEYKRDKPGRYVFYIPQAKNYIRYWSE